MGRRQSWRAARAERLEDRWLLAGDTYLVNFQFDEATTPTRYLRDTGQLFGDRGDGLFYGWTSDHTDQGRERSVLADQRLDTLVHFEAGQSWEFALPNGLYEVTVAVGDPGATDGVHTINVEGVNLFDAVPDSTITWLEDSLVVEVTDGRLTLDQGAAAEKATRINYAHIVGVAPAGNTGPVDPTVTEPSVDGQVVNPADVHMEAVGFFDLQGDAHKSTDWEIWTLGNQDSIYSSPTDGFIEFRFDGGEWPQVHPDSTGGSLANTGEWFGDIGLTSTVLPFQLPELGAVANPFSSADLGVFLQRIGTSTVTNVDLYGVRVDSLPRLRAADYYSGETHDPNATLIQEDFLTPESSLAAGVASNNHTNPAGDAALRDYLNAAYDSGAGAGQYVFLRLSYASDTLPSGWDGYQISTSETASGNDQDPVLNYTTPGDGQLVWQTLGIEGVERLHTHLGDGVFLGPLAGSTELDELTDYELRVRFRDDAGAVSGYSTRGFVTGAASATFPMDLRDIAPSPVPDWFTNGGLSVELPSSGTPATVRFEGGETGGVLATITGSPGLGNAIFDSPTLPDHESTRLVIQAGSEAVTIEESEITLVGDQLTRTVFLPAVTIPAGERLDLWIDSAGGTYFGAAGQTSPDFSLLARSASLNIPFIVTQPGFVIEEVGVDYRLPVNIAFVPDPGPNPDDPLYYVTELYGSIQVVTRDGTKREFATGLLDYNPTGPISGSGEQGLTGIAVQRDPSDPEVYQLYVGMLADNGAPPGGNVHYPTVERITSVAGGLSMDTRTVLLNMQPETQGQSHQISNVSIGPDGKLYVHNGDGFVASAALQLDQYRGKVLRMDLDGTAPTDNPFYDVSDGISAEDYVYAYGLRNPFGGAWRTSDGAHYQVENGPSVDRLSRIERGVSYAWDGSNASMTVNAIYNWAPATAPVNIAFVESATFAGSQFPASMQDRAFVSESGPTYAAGPQSNGKRITEFSIDSSGNLVSGPDTLVEYAGAGRSSVVALAAGPDGLYFSTLYEDTGASGPTASGARIYRVRYVNPIAGDYDIDGDVDQADYDVWVDSFGSNLLLAADGNRNGVIDAGDYTVWRDAFDAQSQAIGAGSQQDASLASDTTTSEPASELAFAAIAQANPGATVPPASVSASTALPFPSDRAELLLLLNTANSAMSNLGDDPSVDPLVDDDQPSEREYDEALASFPLTVGDAS